VATVTDGDRQPDVSTNRIPRALSCGRNLSRQLGNDRLIVARLAHSPQSTPHSADQTYSKEQIAKTRRLAEPNELETARS
jgi:hypothetical protein